MKQEEYQNLILKKLNMIVALLVDIKEGYSGKELTLREKIATLNNAGLNYKEIAQILGKKEGYIAVELTTIKKRKEKLIKALEGGK